jgi:hypothetical protein
MSNLFTPKEGWTGNELPMPARTGEMVCPNCHAEYRPGFTTCSDCHIPLVDPAPPPAEAEAAPVVVLDIKCSQHSEVYAVARCRACSSGVCNTCDFFISNFHFCPRCIDNAEPNQMSPRRKSLATGAMVAAAYCTLAGIFTFTGMLYRTLGSPGNLGVLGLLVLWGLYIPSVIGTVLGFSAFERGIKNPPVVWVALIWNAVLTVSMVVVEVAGRFR